MPELEVQKRPAHQGSSGPNFRGAKQVYSVQRRVLLGSKNEEPAAGKDDVFMKNATVSQQDIEKLREQLVNVRRASLEATQRGDVRAVGKLTREAAQLNQQIEHAECMLLDAA